MPELIGVDAIDNKPKGPCFIALNAHQYLSDATSYEPECIGEGCSCAPVLKEWIKREPCDEVSDHPHNVGAQLELCRLGTFRAPTKPTPDSACHKDKLQDRTRIIFLFKEETCVEQTADIPPWPGNARTEYSVGNSNDRGHEGDKLKVGELIAPCGQHDGHNSVIYRMHD